MKEIEIIDSRDIHNQSEENNRKKEEKIEKIEEKKSLVQEVNTNDNKSIKENISNVEFGSLKNIDNLKRKSLNNEYKDEGQKRKSIQFGEVKDS